MRHTPHQGLLVATIGDNQGAGVGRLLSQHGPEASSAFKTVWHALKSRHGNEEPKQGTKNLEVQGLWARQDHHERPYVRHA